MLDLGEESLRRWQHSDPRLGIVEDSIAVSFSLIYAEYRGQLSLDERMSKFWEDVEGQVDDRVHSHVGLLVLVRDTFRGAFLLRTANLERPSSAPVKHSVRSPASIYSLLSLGDK